MKAPRRALAPVVALALTLGGCYSTPTFLDGRNLASPVSAGSTRSLSLDGEGRLAIAARGGERHLLDVPAEWEARRFGVAFCDLAPLPAVWRPAHARAGGTMVAAIESASPLAIAGLMPFDIVHTLDGEPVEDAEALARALGGKQPGERVVLEVTLAPGLMTEATTSTSTSARAPRQPEARRKAQRKLLAEGPDGRVRVTAQAVEQVGAATALGLPLVSYASTAHGHAFGLVAGPFSLFEHRSLLKAEPLEPRAEDEDAPAQERSCTPYTRERGWRALLGLIEYTSRRDTGTGEEQGTLTLLWFIDITTGGKDEEA